jgi:hypothetical protein
MAVAMLKPVVDQVLQARSRNTPAPQPEASNPWTDLRARIEDQITDTQSQIEKLAKNVTEGAQTLTNQAQSAAVQTLKKTNKRVWLFGGIAVGFGVAGLITFLVTRRRMQAQMDDDTLIPLPDVNSNGHYAPEDQLKNAVAQVKQRQQNFGGTSSTNTTTQTAAPFVGNAHTLVYHPADSDHLPAEENRIYFQSEQEAKDAGYRAAEGE